ncbi:MAG: phospholipase D-like domain-containing protein [Candidatus Micrarchaeaceae archaeon]|jgi:phosphatidylserine/phosphatidylglycerophosphate/cardiolipin synthase-like enzyme|nr:hypothetical protein [Candidatus Micrarchaeota archaeon]
MAVDQKSILYSGDSSYKYVDRLIKEDDSELMIISPYLSGYYVNMLAKAAQERRIRVITSNNSLGYKNSGLQDFAARSISGYIKAIVFFLILDAISVYLNFAYTTIMLTAILLLTVLLAYLRHKRANSNLQVKVITERFVHEKLYISGNTAISGSANLTYNGMHKNIEHIEVTKDESKIREMRRHFESMWNGN